MTNEDRWDVVKIHMAAEVAQDAQASLATMVSHDPVYEYHPLGIRITGVEAITLMYHKMWPAIYPYVVQSESLTMGTGNQGEDVWVNENSVVIKEKVKLKLPDEKIYDVSEMAYFEFDGPLIAKEVIYANQPLADLTLQILGDEFLARPDVSKLY